MPESMVNTPHPVPSEPELRQNQDEPKGVMQKYLKPILYCLAAILVITAAFFSKTVPKTAAQKRDTALPALQDNTANNVQDLKETVTQQEKSPQQGLDTADPAFENMTPAQQAAAAAYGPNGQPAPCIPGQPCTQAPTGYAQQQLSPAEQEAQQLAAKDRELTYESRFASNLVYTRAPVQPTHSPSSPALANSAGTTGPQQNAAPMQSAPDQAASSLIAPQAAGDPPATSSTSAAQPQEQRRPEVNIDSATGKPYVIYEGTTLDTVLMNRLNGDAPGPVKVLVSEPVYSHDRQHVLIPAGTVVLGEAKAIGSPEIGHERRMAMVFHRMIMPDGYSVDLDQLQGLGQSGAEGAKGKVNNHYFKIFGTSIALGVIAGAGQIEEGGGMISTNGTQAFATGASASISESAMGALDRFLNIPPTITVREGQRIKIYFTQDLLLPAYKNHTIPQSF